MRGVTQICLTVSGLCVDVRFFFVLVSLLYVGIVWFVIRLKYIPVSCRPRVCTFYHYNIMPSSAADDDVHMVARNMLSNY